MRDYQRVLTPRGNCVVVGGLLTQIAQAMLVSPMLSRKDGRKIGMMGIAKFNQKDLETLQELLASGKIESVVERRYPLSETAQAILYLEAGHVRGKLVINVADG
jgi:NADPH:quinone reductase-like Zn-dependent oxidoreductase